MPTQEEYFFLTAFARQTKHQRVAKEREKNMNYKVIFVSSAHQ